MAHGTVLVGRITRVIPWRILGIIFILNSYEGTRVFIVIIIKEVDPFIFFESELDAAELILKRSLHGLSMQIVFVETSTVIIIYNIETTAEIYFF